MNTRLLQRSEIPSLWQIDRREFIENVYQLRDGALVLEPHNFDVPGWPPGEAELYTPILLDCFDRGGTFWGVFDNDALVATAVLECDFIGADRRTLQLKFLHVGRDHRGCGVGAALFAGAAEKARALGANKLYVSATPSENTINFYRRRGCALAASRTATSSPWSRRTYIWSA